MFLENVIEKFNCILNQKIFVIAESAKHLAIPASAVDFLFVALNILITKENY